MPRNRDLSHLPPMWQLSISKLGSLWVAVGALAARSTMGRLETMRRLLGLKI